jgi:uncharacterized protein YjbJ (UPF0337 family)
VTAPRAAGATARLPDVATPRRRIPMNKDRIEGNWKQVSGKIREKWGQLTDNDMTEIAGKREQLVGKIQKSYGLARDAAESQVREFEKSLDRAHS